jgi:signal transduction histidine kinase
MQARHHRQVPVSQVIIYHEDGDGLPIFSTVARDISQLKVIEDNLRTALARERELSELKTRFTSMVSHEFRTPLATIRSSSDLLKRYRDRMTEDKQTTYLDKIQEQVAHLTDMIDSVLTISRAQTMGVIFTPSVVDISALVADIVEEMRLLYGTSHTLDLQQPESLPPDVLFDEGLLRQMVVNLISNAVKYSPEDSTVSVTLNCDPETVTLVVSDPGIGIPADERERVFDTFYRARNVGTVPGTGLGMTLIQQAVEAHEGVLHLESAEGDGTTFTITLPLRYG